MIVLCSITAACNRSLILWWKNHEKDLSNWASAFKAIILVQPSSAAAEGVFSLLQSSFTHQQNNSLEDYIEASIMLQYKTYCGSVGA